MPTTMATMAMATATWCSDACSPGMAGVSGLCRYAASPWRATRPLRYSLETKTRRREPAGLVPSFLIRPFRFSTTRRPKRETKAHYLGLFLGRESDSGGRLQRIGLDRTGGFCCGLFGQVCGVLYLLPLSPSPP